MSETGRAPSLAGAQTAFAHALLRRGEGSAPEGLAGASETRFNIHRNTALAGLIGVLMQRFPVVERLVGETFFRAVAHHFVTQCPPRSPALVDYGEEWPAFLDAFEPARTLPYLPDVARLEWFRHHAYHATDAEPMKPTLLAAVPPDRLGETVFQLHPSASLLLSHYPAVSIWETNSQDAQVRPVGVAMGAEAALILRPALEVQTLRLSPGGAVFAAGIAQGMPLAEAATSATDAAPDFDLGAALGALLSAGAFTGIAFGPTNTE